MVHIKEPENRGQRQCTNPKTLKLILVNWTRVLMINKLILSKKKKRFYGILLVTNVNEISHFKSNFCHCDDGIGNRYHNSSII
jgi:hypothetical protein